MKRRNFLQLAAGAAAVTAAAGTGWAARDTTSAPAFLSACNLDAAPDSFAAAALDAAGRVLWRLALQARGHEVALHRRAGLCAIVDRKPGASITLCDLRDGRVIRILPAAAGRHFDGHAVFAADGATLYATEVGSDDEAGAIGVYRLSDGRRLGAFATGGIEPHQIVWAADRRSFIVANGGIRERAADAEIVSGIAAIDAASGRLTALHGLGPGFETLSCRHIAATRAGDVLIGMQDQDRAGDLRPIVGVMDRSGRCEFFRTPAAILERMQGYIGSIAIDPGDGVVVATAPHGGLAGFWRLADRSFLGAVELADGCGAAPTGRPGAFLLTSGRGDRLRIAFDRDGRMTRERLVHPRDGLPRWDNHLTSVNLKPVDPKIV